MLAPVRIKNFHIRTPALHLCWPTGLVVLVGIVLVTGCGKGKQTTPAAAPSPESVNQAAADHMPVPSAVPPAKPAVIAAPNGEPDLVELNRSLLRWILANRRRPANFEDFAATAGVVIPPSPAGKKYVIGKDMHVQLVKK